MYVSICGGPELILRLILDHPSTSDPELLDLVSLCSLLWASLSLPPEPGIMGRLHSYHVLVVASAVSRVVTVIPGKVL